MSQPKHPKNERNSNDAMDPKDPPDPTPPPIDPNDPAWRAAVLARRRLLADVNWLRVRPRLEKLARKRLPPPMEDEAADVVSEAITEAYDPRFAAWDETKQPDVVDYMGSKVNGIIRNRVTLASARGPYQTTPNQDAVDGHRDSDPSPDRMADMRLILETFSKHVEKKFGKKGREFLLLVCDTPMEQAEALGLTEKKLYRLKRNVIEYCRRLKDELKFDGPVFWRYPPDLTDMRAQENEFVAIIPLRHLDNDHTVARIAWPVCLFIFALITYLVMSGR
jgi:hypothetical protein